MEIKKIGIDREIAVCFKIRRKNKTYYFEPIDIIEGFYSKEHDCFFDLHGGEYYHISSSTVEYGTLLFAGRISITKKTIPNLETIKDSYLKEFQKYTFRLDGDDIIARNKDTKKECIYMDELIEFNEELQDVYSQISQSQEENDSQDDTTEESNENTLKFIPVDKNNDTTSNELTPQDITNKLTKYVKGQDEAIRKIATIIYEKLHYPNATKNNLLVIGPTGSGKTFIFKELSKLLDVPLIIFNTTGISQAGYQGDKIKDIFPQLILNAKGDYKKAQRGIVILDELDKLAHKNPNQGFISTEGVQNELLKIIEGTNIIIHDNHQSTEKIFDTSNILFVGAGAFQKLYEKDTNKTSIIGFASPEQSKKETTITEEKLTNYGMKTELIGRLPIIIELNTLTEQDLIDIISSEENVLSNKLEILKYCGIIISNLEEFKHLIAKDAISKKIGARGLNTTIANIFTDILYTIYSNPGKYDTLTLGKNIINDCHDYTLSQSNILKDSKTKKLVP